MIFQYKIARYLIKISKFEKILNIIYKFIIISIQNF